jgi:hypothetical protein
MDDDVVAQEGREKKEDRVNEIHKRLTASRTSDLLCMIYIIVQNGDVAFHTPPLGFTVDRHVEGSSLRSWVRHQATMALAPAAFIDDSCTAAKVRNRWCQAQHGERLILEQDAVDVSKATQTGEEEELKIKNGESRARRDEARFRQKRQDSATSDRDSAVVSADERQATSSHLTHFATSSLFHAPFRRWPCKTRRMSRRNPPNIEVACTEAHPRAPIGW